ncbi:hypothetical protein, partial [Okeania sp. SIO2B9]|uniref:hypothetical protein n=1 Tax=Okeania sp. SIO2B9 TaxID=2607782 RepID=UPI001429EF13
DGAVTVRPVGLLWLGSHRSFENQLHELVTAAPDWPVTVDLGPDPDPDVEAAVARVAGRLDDTVAAPSVRRP